MRLDTVVEFWTKSYKTNEFGSREDGDKKVFSTYALQSETNVNKNLWQYSAFRDASLTRLVVRKIPKEPWEYVKLHGIDYRVVYMQKRKNRFILTLMEYYVDGKKSE